MFFPFEGINIIYRMLGNVIIGIVNLLSFALDLLIVFIFNGLGGIFVLLINSVVTLMNSVIISPINVVIQFFNDWSFSWSFTIPGVTIGPFGTPQIIPEIVIFEDIDLGFDLDPFDFSLISSISGVSFPVLTGIGFTVPFITGELFTVPPHNVFDLVFGGLI